MRLQLSLFLVSIFALFGCETNMHSITQRPVQNIRSMEERKKASKPKEHADLFTRKREILIEPLQPDNSSGSLMQPEDERNYLFTSRVPTQVGSYIPVEIDSLSIQSKTEKDDKNDKAKEPDIQDALLKEFPTLVPPDGENKHLVRTIKMRISHVEENGDLQLTYEHDSRSNEDVHKIQVRAHLPYSNVLNGSSIKTSDLSQVQFTETFKDEVVERNAPEWEDDYSLRISGFSEAGSKQARALQDKRGELEKFRDTLRKQLISFGKEKQQIAKQRDTLVEQEKKLATAQAAVTKESTPSAAPAAPAAQPKKGNLKNVPAPAPAPAAPPAAPAKPAVPAP